MDKEYLVHKFLKSSLAHKAKKKKMCVSSDSTDPNFLLRPKSLYYF